MNIHTINKSKNTKGTFSLKSNRQYVPRYMNNIIIIETNAKKNDMRLFKKPIPGPYELK